MSKIKIYGGKKLSGEVEISGAKNAILPILAATLLTKHEVILHNVPNLSDVHIMLELLKEIGSDFHFDTKHNTLTIFAKTAVMSNIDNAQLSEKIRASSLFLGPLLAINGHVKIPKPGGCKIGARLIDMHLHFLNKMGADVQEDECFIELTTKEKIHGVEANFYKISVGATQNIMMAATLANGKTTINGASLEPEITDLGNFLISMGAKIKGLGTDTIEINGIQELKPSQPYKIIYDRLEAGTYIMAALATKSEILLKNAPHQYLKYFLEVLRDCGANITIDESDILIKNHNDKLSGKSISTAPYPYFPTDLQQIYTTLMTTSNGLSQIDETIFDGRFLFAKELKKMNADIHHKNENSIIINGVKNLEPSEELEGHDLRGSMAVFIAGLKADGMSILKNSYYLDRGYENFHKKFLSLGADIEYV